MISKSKGCTALVCQLGGAPVPRRYYYDWNIHREAAYDRNVMLTLVCA